MSYVWDITIPANTPESAPVKQELKVHPGIVTYIGVHFPNGCASMVGARFFYEEFQIVPLNTDEWITGDDETVPTQPHYDLTDKLSILVFRGASPGTSYDHTLTVRVIILPERVASVAPLIDIMVRFLERIGVL